MAARCPHPIAIDETELIGTCVAHIKPIAVDDLAEPGVLRAPGMIHRHGSLRDRMQWKFLVITRALLERFIPEGQGIEELGYPAAVDGGRKNAAVPFAGETKAL